MKNFKKIAATGLCAALATVGLFGCSYDNTDFVEDGAQLLSELEKSLTLELLGDDIFAWNALSVSPEASYGYEREDEPYWYSYSEFTQSDADETYELFKEYYEKVKSVDVSALDASAARSYRTLEYLTKSYADYYGSEYATDFELLGASYINSEGGLVASFSNSVEGFIFRSESDVQDLLTATLSTKSAFESYLDYASDCVEAGYPLYDSTINAMQEYLGDIIDAGDGYYLYSYVDSKLDDADFLTSEKKRSYKEQYRAALEGSFTAGVRALDEGLESYKGNVPVTERGYLAAAGKAGKAYYSWQFGFVTGLSASGISSLYTSLALKALDCQTKATEISNKYAENSEFQDYLSGVKAPLDMTEPEQMLSWLKEASKKIVPDLTSVPEISFKYMDETVAERTMTSGYYTCTPLDEENSDECITLNPKETNLGELFTIVAHEGYPGHLYAFVKSKEQGASPLGMLGKCMSFTEGWAKYCELAVFRVLAESTDDEVLKAYCEYSECYTYSGYLSMLLIDLQINYYGYSVDDYIAFGEEEESARELVETMTEYPVTYVPYAYGMTYIDNLHDRARKEAGERYSEVEFNKKLLSDGFGPTLERASELTEEYISSVK